MKATPTAALIAGALIAAKSFAQEADAPRVSFDAYGTMGFVYSSEDRADFVSNLYQAEGAGFSDRVSPKVDSRLGLQVMADISPRMSAVVQVVTEQEPDGDVRPSLEWANLTYDFTPDLSVRVGRMVQSTFMVSEYRKVGYATPWVRPPEEVYRMIPVTNFDGVDFTYRTRFGQYTNTVRATYGRSDSEWRDGSDVSARKARTLSNTIEWGKYSLFASLGRYKLTIDSLNPLFDAFRQFGPPGEAIADRYDVDDSQVTIVTVGGRYEPGDWFVMGELGGSSSQTFIGDLRGGYVTGGYRLGAFTPYATVARTWVNSATSDPGLPTEGLPPELAETAARLNAILNAILGSAAEQKSLSLGTRWDFARNTALKLQYDYLDLAAGSPGLFVNTQPGFERGGTASVVSLTLDFVY